jgi:hypothetical protein
MEEMQSVCQNMAKFHRVELVSQRRAMVMTGAVSLVIGLVITRGRK